MAESAVTFSDKIQTVRQVRLTAAQTCLLCLQKVFKMQNKVSEYKFVNIWHKQLEKSGKVHGYWYQPPPRGTAALFSGPHNPDRANYANLRQKEYWPKKEVYLDREGSGYLFSSPYFFLEEISLIGDFGFTFYLGKDQRITDHFRRSFEILKQLTEKIGPGMTFKELYTRSIEIMKAAGFRNFIVSTTDKSKTNLGHTIPFLTRDPDEIERRKIATGEEEIINSLINKSREFINSDSDLLISDNCGFTFEPRFISENEPELPMFSLHLIILFEEGEKEVLGNFAGIFNFLKMDWLTE